MNHKGVCKTAPATPGLSISAHAKLNTIQHILYSELSHYTVYDVQ